MKPQNRQTIREVRIPKKFGNAKICELYYNNSEIYIMIKIRKNVYTFPLHYLLSELTRDLPVEAN